VKLPLVHQEPVMGTVVTFQLHSRVPLGKAEAALGEAVGWLHWVDGTFSTYKSGSEVNRFDRGELPLACASEELREVVALCRRMWEQTDGFFDAWASSHFDPSGVVKGWSIDRASSLIASYGITDHLIDAGGDLLLRGRPAGGGRWCIGVRHPSASGAYCAALSLDEGAVATSGIYERGLHVIDPRSGEPAEELLSVTVVGSELATTDAYATAALAMGARAPGWLSRLEGYEAQVVTPEGRGWWTPGFARLAVVPTTGQASVGVPEEMA
jgi:thiamine biosynthesis lipoprotein